MPPEPGLRQACGRWRARRRGSGATRSTQCARLPPHAPGLAYAPAAANEPRTSTASLHRENGSETAAGPSPDQAPSTAVRPPRPGAQPPPTREPPSRSDRYEPTTTATQAANPTAEPSLSTASERPAPNSPGTRAGGNSAVLTGLLIALSFAREGTWPAGSGRTQAAPPLSLPRPPSHASVTSTRSTHRNSAQTQPLDRQRRAAVGVADTRPPPLTTPGRPHTPRPLRPPLSRA